MIQISSNENSLLPDQVKMIQVDWSADGSGEASGIIPASWVILRAVTKPINSTVSYGIVLNDKSGIDVLGGLAASRSTSATEEIFPIDSTSGLPRGCSGDLAFELTGAGAGDSGSLFLFVR